MDSKTREKLVAIKAMHYLITCMNNENAYLRWIYTVPDQPCETDFVDIAEDDEVFGECVDRFMSLMSYYKADGMFIGGKLFADADD